MPDRRGRTGFEKTDHRHRDDLPGLRASAAVEVGDQFAFRSRAARIQQLVKLHDIGTRLGMGAAKQIVPGPNLRVVALPLPAASA